MNIYNSDCFEIMPTIKPQSVDLIICDLPYGVTHNEWDKKLPLDKLWENYKRIAKPTAAILLFGQGEFYAELIESNPAWFRYDLVWDKVCPTGFLNANRMPLRRHEMIAVFYKQLPKYRPQFTQGNPLHGRGTKYLTKDSINHNYGEFKQLSDTRKGSTQKYPTSIIQLCRHPSRALHPTEKPVGLLELLIKTYTDEGDIVLDNCMGCGSTGVACVNTHRKFVGIEKNDKYFEIAKHRINEAESNNGGDQCQSV